MSGYQGGKANLANRIGKFIQEAHPHIDYYVEPFCGMANVTRHVTAVYRVANDLHPAIKCLWDALKGGWVPPTSVSKEEYLRLKDSQTMTPLKAFAGLSLGFGGNWFGTYARARASDIWNGHKYCDAQGFYDFCKFKQSCLLKELNNLRDVSFTCLDYKDLYIPEGAVVYCDPPYQSTEGYKSGDLQSYLPFDCEEFWQWVRDLSYHAHVYVSELTAPEDFVVCWQVEYGHKRGAKGYGYRQEKIFTWRDPACH